MIFTRRRGRRPLRVMIFTGRRGRRPLRFVIFTGRRGRRSLRFMILRDVEGAVPFVLQKRSGEVRNSYND